ncbi:MFS transporter [Corynebacterium meridianum]|uniref:MFS transporter n=1 Tax=Corynebacterium meridianum TaxID=2765363 RepID=A0A934M4M1_9CORY|nr:MFS transporter [Corynebacterium meridianum]MBI8989181.1 MFS transporter [Corynebacterium meridianum]
MNGYVPASVASALCALGAGALILGRSILVDAAVFFMSLSMSMRTRLFAGQEHSRAVSAWIAAVALDIPVGPVLVSFLLDHFWWCSVFLLNIPLCLIAFI